MAQCTPACANGEECGYDAFAIPQCFKDCVDPTCGGHGSCKQVYGESFLCVCDDDYTIQDESCTLKCEDSCAGKAEKCGLDTNATAAKCYDSECSSCRAPGQCLQSNYGDKFICKCPTGFSSDTSCKTCESGYKMVNGFCYKIDCGDNDSCNSLGSCDFLDNNAHKFLCSCNEGYDVVKYCSECLPDRIIEQKCACRDGMKSVALSGTYVCVENTCMASTGKECNNKGVCDVDVSSGTPVLNCNCLEGMSLDDNCVSCVNSYYKHPVTGECVPDNCVKNCNDNGSCRETNSGKNCLCFTGFSGSDYCATCLSGYKLSNGVCKKSGVNTVTIVTVVICVVVLLAAGGAGLWFFYNLRHRKALQDELLMGQNLIEDNGQLGGATKGLELQI